MRRLVAILCSLLVTPTSGYAALHHHSASGTGIHKIYIGSFGPDSGADYLRRRLIRRLSRVPKIRVIENSGEADAILTGKATVSLKGYHHSDPRIRYRTSSDTPVYDVNMMLKLQDRLGCNLWSGNLKPRFWGSQYVADNVVNQAARHIAGAFR